MEDRVRVKVQITAKHILTFQMYHTYFSLTGVFMMFLALFSLFGLTNGPDDQNVGITLLCLFILLWCIVFIPVNLYLKSMKQSKTVPLFMNPMEFQVSSKGMGIYQNGQSGEASWEEITRIIPTGNVLIFYMGKVRANLLPIDQIPEEKEAVYKVVRKYAGKKVRGRLK